MKQIIVPIVIPAYDPDNRLIDLLKKLVQAKLSPIILVNDGSHAHCQSIFRQAEKIIKNHGVILKHKENQGKGQALKTAFAYVLKTYPECIGVITADSDGQHTPSCIRSVCQAFKLHPHHLILGIRNFNEEDIPWKSVFGNKLTSKILQYLIGIKIADTQTGLRGIPTSFMKDLILLPENRFEFETKMLLISSNQYPIFQVPIQTIYDSVENHQTHFRPIVDSFKIYRILGAQFFKYSFAALTSCMLDLCLFAVFCRLFQNYSELWYISWATVGARVVSAVYNYLINYHITFSNTQNIGKSSCLYALLAVVQMMASAFFVTTGSVIFFFLPEVVIKAIVDTFLFFISYYLQRQYVFRMTRK